MKLFDRKEALKGKLCKTAGGEYAIIYGDTKKSPYLKDRFSGFLIGVIIRDNCLITTAWNYDGSFSSVPSPNDILGILDKEEAKRLEIASGLYR